MRNWRWALTLCTWRRSPSKPGTLQPCHSYRSSWRDTTGPASARFTRNGRGGCGGSANRRWRSRKRSLEKRFSFLVSRYPFGFLQYTLSLVWHTCGMSEQTEKRSTVICGMRYRNAPAAIEWLCNVLGFARHAVYPGPDGTIAHAELTHGGGMIMLGSIPQDEFGQYMKQPDEIG